MTVKELVAKLLEFDQELPVVCGPNGYDSDDHPDPHPVIRERVCPDTCFYKVILPKVVVL